MQQLNEQTTDTHHRTEYIFKNSEYAGLKKSGIKIRSYYNDSTQMKLWKMQN